ncbi:MFS superfamily sulfate permease-like transporter [Natronospira proteinivora]|uniref:MFS superfamily sulfate permease-like transporter n=1 Tax=Natronospira proteinivora TaxID=1807133 RepID=A0ABT1G7L0_9GAMM|nr:putative sulfate/molybdate transporter [Natronospira proteinivora]MCP1727280.1 MFS superfamily sulfate permease-like transporter [Natronospira proteinivora]
MSVLDRISPDWPPRFRRRLGDVGGAFADGAMLFPLLLALAWQTGGSVVVMLATTGVAYIVTGWLFRLPIPVQPLKSLSIMAIAAGASAQELQAAGLLLGAIYFTISFMNVNRLAGRIPDVLVHGFQLGLGIMLLLTAVKLMGGNWHEMALVAFAGALVIGLSRLSGLPFLGVIAICGLLWGIWHADVPIVGDHASTLRPSVVALMVLPQIALTLTNSVLGTQRAANSYYGEAAWRVTPRRLLTSLGLGNLVVGALGGMPYCHGSGGVTAHYRGGARSWLSNVVIGNALLLLAAALLIGGGGLPEYPPALQALLLGVIGVFHIQLTYASWRRWDTALILVVMGSTALLAQSMLWVLVAGVAALTARWIVQTLAGRHSIEGPSVGKPSS